MYSNEVAEVICDELKNNIVQYSQRNWMGD